MTDKHKTIREQLTALKPYQQMDTIFSAGVLRSTKTYERLPDGNYFLIHDFTDGWQTATATLDQMEDYLTGKLHPTQLQWE